MPETHMTHTETWQVMITRTDGEAPWPVIPPQHEHAAGMAPDALIVTVTVCDGSRDVRIDGSGLRLKPDGTPGSLRMRAPWYGPELVPGWAQELAEKALREHGLDARDHQIVPLPGSVRDGDGHSVDAGDGAWPDRFPLGALCSRCQEPVQKMRPEGGWSHTGALPEWMRALWLTGSKKVPPNDRRPASHQ